MKKCKVSMALGRLQDLSNEKLAIDAAKKIGADGIDFGFYVHSVRKENDLYTRGEDAVWEYYTDLKKYADSIGIEIPQTHGRFFGYGISPEENEIFTRDAILDSIATGALGAKYCVIHTPPINKIGDRFTAEEMFKINEELVSIMLPYARKYGFKIALETHGDAKTYGKMEFFGYPENLIEGIERIERNCDAKGLIAICVDTGHTNLGVPYGLPSVPEVIRMLGDRVEVLHLHDNDTSRDQHLIPCLAKIDWKETFAALGDIGFDGWYNLENDFDQFGDDFMVETAEFSVKVMRHLCKTYVK